MEFEFKGEKRYRNYSLFYIKHMNVLTLSQAIIALYVLVQLVVPISVFVPIIYCNVPV